MLPSMAWQLSGGYAGGLNDCKTSRMQKEIEDTQWLGEKGNHVELTEESKTGKDDRNATMLDVIYLLLSRLHTESKVNKLPEYLAWQQLTERLYILMLPSSLQSLHNYGYPTKLVHSQVTIIFVVSVGLFVCAEFFSAVFDPISIKLGHTLMSGSSCVPRI